jgi:type II secretory pathway component GspD/PulD (secretin)
MLYRRCIECGRTGPAVLLAIAALVAWAAHPPDLRAQEKVVQIRLSHRHVSEILPLTKPLVSPGGFISADQRTNSLIIIDNPTVIARIRHLVQELDQAVPLLKIRVRYENTEVETQHDASASAQVESGNTTVAVGKQPRAEEGVEAELNAGRGKIQRQSEYVIRVRSGSTAYIETGYDVPHRERWQALSHRYGYVPETVVFQRVGSGYNIRPVLVGDQVRIEIVPRINYFDNRGRDQKIQFAEAATTLFAPLGDWVDIGGVLGGHREINRQILSDSQHTADNRLTMRLMVTID